MNSQVNIKEVYLDFIRVFGNNINLDVVYRLVVETYASPYLDARLNLRSKYKHPQFVTHQLCVLAIPHDHLEVFKLLYNDKVPFQSAPHTPTLLDLAFYHNAKCISKFLFDNGDMVANSSPMWWGALSGSFDLARQLIFKKFKYYDRARLSSTPLGAVSIMDLIKFHHNFTFAKACKASGFLLPPADTRSRDSILFNVPKISSSAPNNILSAICLPNKRSFITKLVSLSKPSAKVTLQLSVGSNRKSIVNQYPAFKPLKYTNAMTTGIDPYGTIHRTMMDKLYGQHDEVVRGDMEYRVGNMLIFKSHSIAQRKNGVLIYKGLWDNQHRISVKQIIKSQSSIIDNEINNIKISGKSMHLVEFIGRSEDRENT
eukprot:gene10913-12718_t